MERRNRNILVGLIAVVIVIAVFSSFGLPLFASPTPTITLPSPPAQETPGGGSGEQEVGVRVEVTPATVQSVIAVMDRLGSYSRSVTTTLEGVSSTARTWVDGGWTRSELHAPSGVTAHTVVGEGQVWRWYNSGGEVLTWAADGASADADAQWLPTYEDVLRLPAGRITAAGYEERNGEGCVYVEVTVPELDQRERYWVSGNTGLLTGAEIETGGETVWTMTATSPEPFSGGAELFTLPTGVVLHTPGQ